MTEREVPLEGGAHSNVVRIGATVRRASGPWSPAVLDLLRHLEDRGFDGAPRAIGLDDHGREVLTFIDGDPAPPLPAVDRPSSPSVDHWIRRDDVLGSLGRLLRRSHDAAADFAWQGRRWQLPTTRSAETVCHNDLSPWNTIFRDGEPVAFIDWESAAPGPRDWDLTFMAWRWVPPWPEELCRAARLPTTVEDRARRLRLLLDAYGRDLDRSFLTTAAERVQQFLDHLRSLVREGSAWEVELARRGVLDQIEGQVQFLSGDAAVLLDLRG